MYVQSKEKTGIDVCLWNLKAQPQWHTTPSSKAKPPKPLYMPRPIGTHVQTLVSMGEISFRPSQPENCILINLLCCHVVICWCMCSSSCAHTCVHTCAHAWMNHVIWLLRTKPDFFPFVSSTSFCWLCYQKVVCRCITVKYANFRPWQLLQIPRRPSSDFLTWRELTQFTEHHPTRPVYQSFVTPLASQTLHSLETKLLVDFFFFTFCWCFHHPASLPQSQR